MPRIESRKLQSPAFDFAHLRFAHVLAVDMADARPIGARERRRIGAAPARMAGVEQEMHRRLGVRHERVDVAFRLDDRSHVVMVAELEALVGEPLGKFGHLRAEAAQSPLPSRGRSRQRPRPVAVDGVRRLGDDDDIGARALGHRDMRLAPPRTPPAPSAAGARSNTSRRRRPGRTRRACLQRRAVGAASCGPSPCRRRRPPSPPRGRSRAACRRRSPGDRRSSSRSGWRRCGCSSSVSDPLDLSARPRIRGGRRRPPAAVRDCRHGDVPPEAAGVGRADRIGVDHDHLGRLRRARRPERRLELGDRCDLDRFRAQRARMRDEIDLGQRPRAARRCRRLLNGAPPVACCSRLMQPKPRLSRTTMMSFLPEHHRGRDLGIHHQIGAVADRHDDLAVRQRHLDAERRRRSRSPCRNSRIRRGSRAARPAARACAIRPAVRRRRRRRRRSSRPPRMSAPITSASVGSGALVGAV